MSRKKQQLINYHTGSQSAMPLSGDVQFGEIVVRHNEAKPEILIKVPHGTNGDEGYYEHFATFISSGAVETAINAAITQSKGETDSNITNLQNYIDAVSATVKNDYALSSTTHEEIEKAKIDAEIASSAYTDSKISELSGNVVSAIEGLTGGELNELSSRVTNLENFSGYVETHYATSADTVAAIKTAKDEAVTSAYTSSTAYTDSQIQMLSGVTSAYVESQLSGATHDISELQSDVTKLKAFSGYVETNYATKEFVGSASGYALTKAKEDLIGASTDAATADTIWGAKNYASGLTNGLSGNVVTAINAEKTRAENAENGLQADIDYVSGAVSTLSGDMKSYIDSELSTVYTYKGSVEDIDALSRVENPEVGDVYNVIAASGEIGTPGYTPAGTNYAWVSGSPEGHWDALGGTVDLSNYATTGDLASAVTRIETLESESTNEKAAIDAISGAVSAFSASVVSDMATHTEVGTASANAITSAVTSSQTYTDAQIQMLSGVTSAYVGGIKTSIDNEINTIKQDYAYSSITHTEIDNAKTAVVGTDANTSADTNTLAGLKKYSDQKDAELSGNVVALVSEVSGLSYGQLSGLSGNVVNEITQINGDITNINNTLNSISGKAQTAIQGAEFGEVTSSDSHYDGGSTLANRDDHDSGAKLMYTEGGNIKIDLDSLIIDCGEF